VTDTEHRTADTIGIVDVVKAMPTLLRDAPTLISGVAGLATTRPSSRNSIGRVFQTVAAHHPERTFIKFEDTRISYARANAQVNRYAAVLAEHGIGQASVVSVLMTNRAETLLVALAVVKLGATASMLNYNQRAEVLNHSLKLVGSTVTVVGAECREALDSLPDADNHGVVLGVAKDGAKLAGHPDLDELASNKSIENPEATDSIRADAKAFYIFTSGTTGLPKASTMSHQRWIKGMAGLGKLGVRLRGDDTMYCALPLYHNNGLTVALGSVLGAGATLALGKSFSASRFWEEIVRYDATAFCYIGELCRYLLAQPAKPIDRQHRVRVVVGNGLRPEIWNEFQERFGIERISEFYGASECNIAFVNALNIERTAGTCPLPYAVVEYDQDLEQACRDSKGRLRKVKSGEVGLLITKITGRAPFDGYTDPDATEQKLIRDGFKSGDQWFNTGDLVRDQGYKHVAFVDRLGDTFRWKGENVATTEVEAALAEYADVDTAVVYGVAVKGTDGKAGMAAIKLTDGAVFDGAGLAKHLTAALPSYAVPLFVRLVDGVSQTSTFKNQKVELRNEGYDTTKVSDPVYVFAGREAAYVAMYEGYAADVATGSIKL